MTLAFSSKHPHVPNVRDQHDATRWIASLSDGSTVFEDVTPNERSAWMRLRDYIEIHDLKLTNLRLEAYGRRVQLIPYKDDEGNAQINGYWHSKTMGALLHDGGVTETKASGIGILKGQEVWITWVDQTGSISHETRPYKKDDLAVIVNDPPA